MSNAPTTTVGVDTAAPVSGELDQRRVDPTVRRKAVRASRWVVGGELVSKALRFGGNVALVWLGMMPSAFGLMALVNATMNGLRMFSDVGINFSVIHNRRGEDPAFLNTALTIQVIRGAVLFVLALALTWPIATLCEAPELLWLMPVTSLTALFGGLLSTKLYGCNRRMELGKITALQLATQVVALSVMIGWASISPTVWALVVGGVISTAFSVVVSHWITGGPRQKPQWDRDAARAIFHYGVWIFMSTALTFLGTYSDRFIFAPLIGMSTLGIYSIASMMVEEPAMMVQRVCRKVAMPAVAQNQDLDRDELRRKYLKYRLKLLLPMALGFGLLMALGDIVIRLVYTPEYEAAAWMLPLLVLGIWPRMLARTISPTLFALGKPQWTTLGDLLKLAVIVAGVPLGFMWLGIVGMIAAVSISSLPFYVVTVIGVSRERMNGPVQDLVSTLIFAGVFGVAVLARLSLGLGMPFSIGF